MQHLTRESEEHLSIIEILQNAMEYFFRDFYAFVLGCVATFICYLVPIKNIVNLLIILFIFDVIFGYWAARTIKKEKFSVKIIWEHTIPRMLISVVLILCTFMWDETYKQDFVSTHIILGWFISGVIIYSIAKNGFKITNWVIFEKISDKMHENIKERTGLDIDDKE